MTFTTLDMTWGKNSGGNSSQGKDSKKVLDITRDKSLDDTPDKSLSMIQAMSLAVTLSKTLVIILTITKAATLMRLKNKRLQLHQ